jgi:hypothetical protein
MMAYGGVDVQTHIFLTSALAEGEWSASATAALPPPPPYPLARRLGGPQSQSERHREEKIFDPTRI